MARKPESKTIIILQFMANIFDYLHVHNHSVFYQTQDIIYRRCACTKQKKSTS